MNIIDEKIKVSLKSINYNILEPEEKKEIKVHDDVNIISVKKEVAELEVSRTVNAQLNNSFNLKIVTSIFCYAKENDLTTFFNDDYVKENIVQISALPLSYVSTLIAQITSSFNGFPVITAPVLQNNE
jgi:hypothetical protein